MAATDSYHRDMDVFRPRTTGLAWAVVALPLLAAVAVALGVVAFLELGGLPGATVLIVCGLLALIPLSALAAVLRRWFKLRLDADALTVIGLLGIGRVRLPWADQVAIGLSSWRGARLLAVRPVTPLKRSPRRALIWDRENGVLLIGSLDNWSAPRDEVLSALHRHAGTKWVDQLDAPDKLSPA